VEGIKSIGTMVFLNASFQNQGRRKDNNNNDDVGDGENGEDNYNSENYNKEDGDERKRMNRSKKVIRMAKTCFILL